MSTPQWFYAENENRLGPVPLERIADLILSGGLERGALVWRHGMPDWKEAGGVPEIASLLPPPLPAGKAAGTPTAAPAAAPQPASAKPEPPPASAKTEPQPASAKGEPKSPQPTPAPETKKGRSRAEATAKPISDVPKLDGAAGAFRGLADGLIEQRPPAAAPAPPPAATPLAAPAAPAPSPAASAPSPAASPADEPIIIEEDEVDTPKVAWPSGRLADHEFSELVREVHGRRWNGLLTLNHMGVEKSVRIQEGRLVFASSSSHDDRLGELLLRRGRITLDQYVEAGRGIRKGKRLGTVLVEMGALDARELVKVVVDHTQEIIYGAFQWTEGLYHLTETPDPAEPIVLRLSTPDIILEGIRRIDRWSRIERAVGTLETRYQRTDRYETALKQMTLSPDKLALLTGLSGVQDLGTMCRRSNMPHFEACRTVWAFRVIGAIRRLD